MAYYLLDDQHADDPVWDALSGGKPALLDAIQAAYIRLCSKAAHLLTDGYLTAELAARYARPQVLELLTRPVLGRPPRLHRPGDECPCLGDDPWIEGYAFRIHKFLRRNPSRSEYNRDRAQKADLRDARLKHTTFERDGGCCRYCRSGPLSPKAVRAKDRRKVLQFDHVDPDRPAGADGANLVTACGCCNEHKGRRTPDEADMALLPPPNEPLRSKWLARETPVLYDRGQAPAETCAGHTEQCHPSTPDQTPITDESPTNQNPIADRTTDAITDHDRDPIADHDHQTTPEPHHDQPEQAADQARGWSGKGAGAGRDGSPDPDGPGGRPDTPRDSSAPDIYTRRSRPPSRPRTATTTQQPHRPAPPDEGEWGWPPGSTRTKPEPGSQSDP